MNRRIRTGLVISITASSLLGAQDSTSTPTLFVEKSYVALLTPTGKDLLFEALPAGHFFFWNALSDIRWQKAGGWKMTSGLSFLPEVRMSTDRSNPVRTPGYRIRTNTDVVRLWRGAQAQRLHFRMHSFGVTAFGHYSNGQSGCRFKGFSYRAVAPGSADSTCIATDPVLAARMERNYDSGDFSTSYFAAAARGRYGVLGEEASPVKRQIGWTLEYQLHPLGLRPGAIDRELRRDYGGHQISASVEAECRSNVGSSWSGVTRVSVLGLTRFGPDSRPLHRGYVELAHVFDRLKDFGVFARYHAGFDYYNIRLYDRKPFFSAGIVWDVGRLDFLTTEAVAQPTEPAELRLEHCFGRSVSSGRATP